MVKHGGTDPFWSEPLGKRGLSWTPDAFHLPSQMNLLGSTRKNLKESGHQLGSRAADSSNSDSLRPGLEGNSGDGWADMAENT